MSEQMRGERGPTGDKGYHGQTGDQGSVGAVGPEGPKGDKGDEGNKYEAQHKWRWRLLAGWIAIFTLAVGLALNDRRAYAEENRARIIDIQEARADSCRQTYEGIREAFRPFFRPVKDRTPKEARDVKTFNDTLNKLKSECPKQTRTEKEVKDAQAREARTSP